jgi:hypothetical protein
MQARWRAHMSRFCALPWAVRARPGGVMRQAELQGGRELDISLAARANHTASRTARRSSAWAADPPSPEDPCRPSPATTWNFPGSTQSEDLVAGAMHEVEVPVRTGSARLRTLGRHGDGIGRRTWSQAGRGRRGRMSRGAWAHREIDGDSQPGRQEHGREYEEPSASPAVSGPVEEVPGARGGTGARRRAGRRRQSG